MNCESLEFLIKQLLSNSPELCVIKRDQEILVIPFSKLDTEEYYMQVDDSLNFVVCVTTESEADLVRGDMESIKQAVRYLK